MRIRMNYEPSEDNGIDFRELDKVTGKLKYVPGKTKQSEAAACDINNILARYEATGSLPDLINENPQYGDFTQVPTYQEAYETVFKAQEQFEALPAKVRDRFHNDPVKMLEFVNDPANADEMVRLGMRIPKIEEGKKGEPVENTELKTSVDESKK